MPFINIKVLKGTLSKEKKQEMIKRVSETVAEIEASSNPKDNLTTHMVYY
jgi:4-oxalocrotonate tautomerase family enzyme